MALRAGCYQWWNFAAPAWYANWKKKNCYGGATVKKTEAPAEVSTDTICGSYCGKWSTKKDAINSLFNHYRRTKGKVLRWYVNWEGYLEWFEVGDREGIENIYEDDPRVISFKATEDATNIKNYLKGSYGDSETGGTVTKQSSTSINIYGKCVDDSYSDVCMDEDEMDDFLTKELTIKAVPIYNATVILSSFYLIEPGKQIKFPDDDFYGSLTWTVVDWEFTDGGGNPLTTINLTTDETVISPPNEFEIIQNTAAAEVAKSLPEAARVVSVVGDTHLLVEKEIDKSRVIVRSLAINED